MTKNLKFTFGLYLILFSKLYFTALAKDSNQNEELLEDYCAADSDCSDFPFKVCNKYISLCEHKSVFPMQPTEIAGFVILSVIMSLSTVAGIGGGGIVVPLIMVFYQFETKRAIAISGFSILTCSITRFFFTIKQKHPEKDMVVVDYSLATIMLPSVLIGSYLGVIFNVAFPSLILVIILTLLLSALSIQAGLQSIKIFKNETKVLT